LAKALIREIKRKKVKLKKSGGKRETSRKKKHPGSGTKPHVEKEQNQNINEE